nr:GNAT family N-acetyltransferase [Clostridia bacterium]
MTLQNYLCDPCGTLSIPYWKAKAVQVPPHMRIVHDREYNAAAFTDYDDEPYFRLKHDLKAVTPASDAFTCRAAAADDLPLLVDLINRSYEDLSVSLTQLQGYRTAPVFAADLWLIALDAQTGEPVGCGIADLDPEAHEGVLEWIQVLPERRGRGAGQFIVNALLRRMNGRADFATVSGQVNNRTSPEKLYRRCGFTGADVWHILVRK